MFTQRGIIGHLKFCRPQETIDDPDSGLPDSLEDHSIGLELPSIMDISEDETISDDPASSQNSGHSVEPIESNIDHAGAQLDDVMNENSDIDVVDLPTTIEDDEDEGEWWDQYCVHDDAAATIEAGAEEAEDFEELLRWIDQEMLLEVSESCKSFSESLQ
jgi:hypothetical protein